MRRGKFNHAFTFLQMLESNLNDAGFHPTLSLDEKNHLCVTVVSYDGREVRVRFGEEDYDKPLLETVRSIQQLVNRR